ncbi:helix-turn-helix domain-containing protein [Marihabitans asiaticum]|uniref:helix-turn-helix domain-containing protein n=1 Tax=Marihabitans asiaticum TaxID=415218 RepID=UPI00119D48FF|nr:helix-turn-helix transcriptional regulator [Marihabitans asiaticum]
MKSGRSLPSRSEELAQRRAALTVAEVAATVLRQGRRARGESQRDLARRLGRTKSAVARLESSPGGVRLEEWAQVLGEVGCWLAVIDEDAREVTADRWGVTELLLTDRAGRRLPATAHAEVDYDDSCEVVSRFRRAPPTVGRGVEAGDQRSRTSPRS